MGFVWSSGWRRQGLGLLFVLACGLGAVSCGEFQLAEFTAATTTTIEVEPAVTTIVDSPTEQTETTLRPARYVVEPGETLGSISVKFSVPVDTLMLANAMVSAKDLAAGQELVIPDPFAPVTPPWQLQGTDGQKRRSSFD